jgi:hypothetical protein
MDILATIALTTWGILGAVYLIVKLWPSKGVKE